MKTEFKAQIEKAIQRAFDAACEGDQDYWDWYIHDSLVAQMVNAAEQVFDAAQSAQEFSDKQKP